MTLLRDACHTPRHPALRSGTPLGKPGIDGGAGDPLVVAIPGVGGVEDRLALIPAAAGEIGLTGEEGDEAGFIVPDRDRIAAMPAAVEDVAEHHPVGAADQPLAAEVAVEFDDQPFALADRGKLAPERRRARLPKGSRDNRSRR